MPNPPINRAAVEAAFEMLSERLVDRGVEATVVLFGDVAMMLAHDARESIDHVDAMPRPRGPVMGAARETGERLDLHPSWFTDQASGTLPQHLDDDLVDLFVRPNLIVRVLGPELLLAMTALKPNRPEDISDIRLLAASLGITSSIDVEVLIAELFPGRTLAAKARTTLDDLL